MPDNKLKYCTDSILHAFSGSRKNVEFFNKMPASEYKGYVLGTMLNRYPIQGISPQDYRKEIESLFKAGLI